MSAPERENLDRTVGAFDEMVERGAVRAVQEAVRGSHLMSGGIAASTTRRGENRG
jgi:hypothetical protein